MALTRWIDSLVRKSKRPSRKRRLLPREPRYRPRLEALEDRCLPSASLDVPQWTAQGPGPILNGGAAAFPNNEVTGAVESIAVANVPVTAQNPGGLVMYAGTVNGGVWRADNASLSEFGAGFGSVGPNPFGPSVIDWKPLTDQQPSLGTTAMALDPADTSGNTLWVGTGSFSSFRQDGANGVGLLRTTDGGRTWSNVGKSLAGSQIFGIVPTHVQVGANVVPGAIVATYGPGVQYSLNNGQSFQLGTIAGTSTLLTGNASDVVADPNNNQRFYAGVAGKGVFRSDDGGQTWTDIVPDLAASSSWIKLAVHKQNRSTVLYVGVVGTNQNVIGVFRTTISSTGSPIGYAAIGAVGTGAGLLPPFPTSFFHFGFTADPVDANTVYVSGYQGNLYRGDASAMGGKGSWSPLATSTSGPHADSRSLTVVFPNLLLESDDGGVFGLANPRTSSSGWDAASANMRATEFFSVSVDPTTGLIAGGSQDNGTSEQTTLGGVAWNEILGGDGGLTQFASDGTLYYMSDMYLVRGSNRSQVLLAAATSPSKAYSGLNTTDAATLTAGGFRSWVYALNPYPGNQSRLLVGLTGLYESTDQGATVTKLTPTGLTGNVTAITYGANNTAYVGTDKRQLWVRTSATATFQQITTWPPSSTAGYAVRIVVDPNDYRIAYVLDSKGNVWETTDGDQAKATWAPLTDNLDSLAPAATVVQLDDNTLDEPRSPVQTIELYDPTPGSQPGDGVLLAGGLGGVFSLRLGSSDPCWHQLGNGLPNAVVSDLHYSPARDVLLAGTYGRGAWTISNASLSLFSPTTLSVVADRQATNNVIDIRPDPNNRTLLQVVEDGVVEYDGPYSYIAQVSIYAANPGDTIRLENLPACLPFLTQTAPGHGYNFIESEASGFPSLITVASLGATDTIHIGDASHSLNQYGTLVIQGDGVANVVVDDSGNVLLPFFSSIYQPNLTQYIVGSGQLTRGVLLQQVGGPPTDPMFWGFTATINYSGLADLAVTGGPAGVYTYQVNSTAGAKSVTIKAASALDTVTLGDASDNLAFIGTVNVQGNGNTMVTVDDSDNAVVPLYSSSYEPTLTQYTVGRGQLTRIATLIQVAGPPTDPRIQVFRATINYSGLTNLAVTGGPVGLYSYQVNSTAGANSVTIKAASALDEVTLGDASHNLAFIGILNVQGNGNTTVRVDDSDNVLLPFISSIYAPILTQYTVGSGQLTRLATLLQVAGPPTDPPVQVFGATINYSGLTRLVVIGGPGGGYTYQVTDTTGMKNLILNGGPAASSFSLQGTSAGTSTTVNGGTTADQISVGSAANTLESIHGRITVKGRGGNTALNINDQGNNSTQRYEYDVYADHVVRIPATPGQPLGSPTQTITYFGIANLNLHASNADSNLIGVIGTPANTAVSLYAGSGRSTEFFLGSSVDGLDETQGPLAVHGTNSSDIALDFDYASPSSHTYTLSAPNPTTTVLQRVGAAAITHDGIGELLLTTAVLGGNTIKIQSAGFAPAVFVAGGSNSTLDYSSYIGDVTVNLVLHTATALAGISGIENVTGSIGNDLLVGDANANVLIGGAGRNIIIGGGGADTLTGGDGDNILIGGRTSYDDQQSQAALALIMQEWLQSSSFADRMAAIENGTDLLANTGIHFGADTVFPDGLSSVIPGPGNNWIIS
jgi:hypothetical protein